jgi:putative hemolysin
MKRKIPMASENNLNSSNIRLNLEVNGFLVKIAETEQEIRAAQRLRFEIFNLEMNEGLNTSWQTGLDQDQYDEHADHLIVVNSKSGEVVGTYRILTKSVAKSNGGFYSEGEFDLSNLKELPEEILEIGRSCVHKDYRSNGVINLLWAGIIRYMELSKAKYVFGCGSLHTHNVDEVSEIYSYLKSKYYSDDKYRVYPHQKCVVPGLKDNVPLNDTREIMKKLPPLLKGYFRLGAYICGEPALDAEFGTTDFFIFLPTDQMTKRYQRHYKTISLK